MLPRLLLISVICLGCSGKSDAPSTAATGPTLGFPFVPDAIANQIGDANVIIALDLSGLDIHKLTPMIPDEISCVREVVNSVGVVVLASGVGQPTQGFVTGVPEAATKRCVESLVPMFGGTAALDHGVYTLALGDTKASMAWKDGTLTVQELGQTFTPGAPSAAKRALIAQVPKDAKGWIVSGAFPKYKIKESIVWIRVTSGTWHIVVNDEGTEPGAAQTWTADIIRGFKEGASQKGIVVEDSWFKLTSPTPLTAHLEADIPADIFQRAAQP